MVRNLKLTVAYDGSRYHGFQRQENALSIQQVLEDKLAEIFGVIKLTAAARTDTGVHAYGQVVNFKTEATIPTDRITLAGEGVLPPDIVVVDAEEALPDFNARRLAKGKLYRYRILNRKISDPLERNYSWHYRRHILDAAKINELAQIIVGEHDFSAFKSANRGAPIKPVKTIFAVSCAREADFVAFEFRGSGFLYHMVRNLVGTLVGLDKKKLSEASAELKRILDGKDRKSAGITAPAQGLYLVEVKY